MKGKLGSLKEKRLKEKLSSMVRIIAVQIMDGTKTLDQIDRKFRLEPRR